MEKNALVQLQRFFSEEYMSWSKGLTGVEVVADDLVVVVGWGSTSEVAAQDHDKNLKAVLARCKDRNQAQCWQLRIPSAPFIGHVATAKGPSADPAKVKAITEMPLPKDVKDIQWLLGLAKYLPKFYLV